MKARIYLRVAKGGRKGIRVAASSFPVYEPLKQNNYSSLTFFPTVSFAVDFEIPDELFRQAEIPIAEINVALKNAKVEGRLLVPVIQKAIKSVTDLKSNKI